MATDLMKHCRTCDQTKIIDEFAVRSDRPDGRVSKCKACDRAKASAYYAANKPRKAAYFAARAGQVAEDRAAIRAIAVRIYGGACEACGATTDLEFDHPKGDGAAHRSVEDAATYIRRIARTGARLDDVDLRLLCVPHHREYTAEQVRQGAIRKGPRIGSTRALTPAQAQRALDMRTEGASRATIQAALGCSKTTLQRVLTGAYRSTPRRIAQR